MNAPNMPNRKRRNVVAHNRSPAVGPRNQMVILFHIRSLVVSGNNGKISVLFGIMNVFGFLLPRNIGLGTLSISCFRYFVWRTVETFCLFVNGNGQSAAAKTHSILGRLRWQAKKAKWWRSHVMHIDGGCFGFPSGIHKSVAKAL